MERTGNPKTSRSNSKRNLPPTQLHTYSKFLTSAAFLLILAGGLVTSTHSGLSVPDWPLSYGQYFPPMIGGIRFEHSHRVIAGLVGILTFALSFVFLRKEKRKWVRNLAGFASILVIMQALLGGITVLYLLPTIVSVLHACVAQTFFCLLAVLALVTSKEWTEHPIILTPHAESLKRLLVTTTGFIYAQLIAGALVRHSQNTSIHFHLVLAFLILLHALLLIRKIGRDSSIDSRLFNHAIFLGICVIIQIFLGLGAFAFTRIIPKDIPPWHQVFFATTHQGVGALILMASVTLTLRAFRLTKQTDL